MENNKDKPLKSIYSNAVKSIQETPETNFIQRAFLKNAINESRPDSVKLKGIEYMYSPVMQKVIPLIGDSASTVLQFLFGDKMIKKANAKIDSYLAEGKSPEVNKQVQKINDDNLDIFTKSLSKANSKKLIENTRAESKLPTDWLDDVERFLKENPGLSDEEIESIISKKLEQFEKDPKLLNNLEATRPDSGTLGHSLDTADVFATLLRKSGLNLSEAEIMKKYEAAKLHDYAKGATPFRDVDSMANPRTMPNGPERDYARTKVVENIGPHDKKGFASLALQDEGQAAYYASVHHGVPESLEDNLLKMSDIFNALTGKRSYKKPYTFIEALNEMEGMAGKVFSKEAFDILKKSVQDGSMNAPKNYESELYKVYQTDRGNALKSKGITLFDVDATKFAKGKSTSPLFSYVSAPIKTLRDDYFPRISNEMKKKALYNVYKRKGNVLEANKIRGGFYNDETLNQIFSDNIDDIIKIYKF